MVSWAKLMDVGSLRRSLWNPTPSSGLGGDPTLWFLHILRIQNFVAYHHFRVAFSVFWLIFFKVGHMSSFGQGSIC